MKWRRELGGRETQWLLLLIPSLEKWNLRKNQCRGQKGKKESLEGRANWLCLMAELSPPGLVTGTWGSAFRWRALVYGPRKKGTTCSRNQVRASDSTHTGARRSRNTSQDAETRLKRLPAESIWNMSSEHESARAERWGEEAWMCRSVRADSDDFEGQPGPSRHVLDQSQSAEGGHKSHELEPRD